MRPFSRDVELQLLRSALLHGCIANLIERLESACSNLYSYPATFFRYPDTLLLDVRQEATTRLVVRVRHVIAVHYTYTREFTSTSHCWTPFQTLLLSKTIKLLTYSQRSKYRAMNRAK